MILKFKDFVLENSDTYEKRTKDFSVLEKIFILNCAKKSVPESIVTKILQRPGGSVTTAFKNISIYENYKDIKPTEELKLIGIHKLEEFFTRIFNGIYKGKIKYTDLTTADKAYISSNTFGIFGTKLFYEMVKQGEIMYISRKNDPILTYEDVFNMSPDKTNKILKCSPSPVVDAILSKAYGIENRISTTPNLNLHTIPTPKPTVKEPVMKLQQLPNFKLALNVDGDIYPEITDTILKQNIKLDKTYNFNNKLYGTYTRI